MLHRSTIDAHAKKILVHAEGRVGLTDGSCVPGIAVTFYINGKPCSEVLTDEVGRAVLDTGISPDFCSPGTNELVTRVGNSAKTRTAHFELHERSWIDGFHAHQHFDANSRKFSGGYEYRCEEWCELTIELAAEDFADVNGVEWSVALIGDGFIRRSVISDATGTAKLELENRYTSRHYCSRDEGEKPAHLGLKNVSEIWAELDGFPPRFRLDWSKDDVERSLPGEARLVISYPYGQPHGAERRPQSRFRPRAGLR
jgi:hypothetical protein